MNPGILFAVMAKAFVSQKPGETVKVVAEPKHTLNAFGHISDVAGKSLVLVERNPGGDCLCLLKGPAGPRGLVDVDYRDIESEEAQQCQS